MANNIPTAIKSWFKTLSSNQPDGSDLFSSLVDDLRAIQTAVRAWFEDAEWRDYGHTPTRIADDQFTVTGDQTAVYIVGRAIKCMEDENTFYGIITDAVYDSESLTTVTVSLDSGTLTALLYAVALGIDNSNGALRTASTAAVDTSTTQIATTAFVTNQASASNPIMDGTAAIGTSKRYAREDHVHPSDASKAGTEFAFQDYTDNANIGSLTTGSASGSIFYGRDNLHTVIAIRADDLDDGFHVIGQLNEDLDHDEYTDNLFKVSYRGIFYRGNKVWHEGNDGAGSGLDAALLNGQPGSYYLSGTSKATQSDMEAATRDDVIVTPANAHWHPTAAKVWGKVSVSGGTPTLDISFGVSSITDTGIGKLTVNFPAFSSAHYSVVASFNKHQIIRVGSQTATSILLESQMISFASSNYSYQDPDFWYFAAFGDK